MLLAGSIFILNINSYSKKKKKVPNWLRKVLFIKPKKNSSYEIKMNVANKEIYSFTTLKRSVSYGLKENNNNNNNQVSTETTIYKKLNCSCLNKLERHLIAIYKLLNSNFKKLENEKIQTEQDNEMQNDWLQVTKRVESIFFVVSFLIIVVTPVYLFGKYFLRYYFSNNAELTGICGCHF